MQSERPARRGSARGVAASRNFDRAAAEHYWGEERTKLADEFKIVLSAGEPAFVNAAYHLWEMSSFLRALKPRRGVRVLDLACGLGRVSAPLALTGATVIGVDNALAMAQAASRKTQRAGKAERVRTRAGFVQAFSGSLPFVDRTFDAVLCLGLLEHLPGWLQEKTLAEGLRVLKRGGALYLVLNNNRSLLLRAGSDNRYRQARQLPNGYYCGLVDRRRLVAGIARRGARVEELGSNGHYAVLRHALHGRGLKRGESQEAVRAFAAATERDLSDPRQGEFGETCADHFLYRIVRR
ncbi:MAG: class I SAM-dependent methyltransferase [Candidatus Eiseniibacteriota bacterium]